MKCPFCAETIQDEAKKCRFCGEIITRAAQAGFPEFYINATETGLTWYSLGQDYGEHTRQKPFGDDGSMFCFGDWFGAIRREFNDDDFVSMTRTESRLYREGINERLRDYAVGAEETKVLNMILTLIKQSEWMFSAVRNRERSSFESILASLTTLREEIPALSEQIQKDWYEFIDSSISSVKAALEETPQKVTPPVTPPKESPSLIPTEKPASPPTRSGCLSLLIAFGTLTILFNLLF